MAHKTFISYKHSEACELRDRIIKAMGEDAMYYQGETSDSPDKGDEKTAQIKKYLSDMLYDTSVTIVIISPHIKESKWIDWEIEYSLSFNTRKGRTSRRNGVVGVIQKVNGSYNWFKYTINKPDGHEVNGYHTELLYSIINNNRDNRVPKEYHCSECKSIDALTGSYISFVEEEDFLANINKYIDNAYQKSENDAAGYDIHPSR